MIGEAMSNQWGVRYSMSLALSRHRALGHQCSMVCNHYEPFSHFSVHWCDFSGYFAHSTGGKDCATKHTVYTVC